MPLPPDDFAETGAPFGMYPEVPAALIVTEDLRLWSLKLGLELTPTFAPFATAGESTVGTAGTMGFRPFNDETLSDFPLWG